MELNVARGFGVPGRVELGGVLVHQMRVLGAAATAKVEVIQLEIESFLKSALSYASGTLRLNPTPDDCTW